MTTPTDLERVRPHNESAERAVLGAMILDKRALNLMLRQVHAGHFYKTIHANLFDAMSGMARKELDVDPITLGNWLTTHDQLGRVGGPTYLHTLVEAPYTAANAEHYAEIIRDLAQRRALVDTGIDITNMGYDTSGEPIHLLAERGVELTQKVRDAGVADDDLPTQTLAEFLAETDDVLDMVIPGVLARRERWIFTGPEGGGKSLFTRQLCIRTAAGLHPWKADRIPPQRVLLIDAENPKSIARPWLRNMERWASSMGAPIADGNMWVEFREDGLDLTSPADRAWLLRRVETIQPALLAVGPLYKLSLGDPKEEEGAKKVMSCLDAVRNYGQGCALFIEAHSPHPVAGSKYRPVRPVGSSAWLRWPEFGNGLRLSDDPNAAQRRHMRIVPWRGNRAERDFPKEIIQGSMWPWTAITHGDGRG